MSHTNPAGFRRYNLARLGGWRLRLHVWTGQASEWPHDHRWPFTALPLIGTFAETRWAAGPGARHRILTASPSTAAGRTYREAGTVLLTPLATHIRWLLPYRCLLGEIHSVKPIGSGPHVTLVLHAPARRETSTVYRPEGS